MLIINFLKIKFQIKLKIKIPQKIKPNLYNILFYFFEQILLKKT